MTVLEQEVPVLVVGGSLVGADCVTIYFKADLRALINGGLRRPLREHRGYRRTGRAAAATRRRYRLAHAQPTRGSERTAR